MTTTTTSTSQGLPSPRFRAYARRDLDAIPQVASLPAEQRFAMKVVSAVFPFRVNPYVCDELIDWSRVPDDPMFQLTFPQRGMLSDEDFAAVADLLRADAPSAQVDELARKIQRRHNPHPAGQKELNVPAFEGAPLHGIQHKYRETVLFFPVQGQTCHAYCSYCFRWPQFVGLDDMKFAAREIEQLIAYLRAHPEVTDVLFTGGDPMVMRTSVLKRYLEPLIAARIPTLRTIRIGTKAPAYWPQRFVSDNDADELLELFESAVRSGIHLALMAHFSHPAELRTKVAEQAIRRIRNTGAVVRCQAPLIRHVNDDADAWARMWTKQVSLGAVPYYMFVARDTGPRQYFEVPLAKAVSIFRDAVSQVSGLARTVRGPSMSATPGKVTVDGTAEIGGERVFALRFLQARDPSWVGRPFFARYDESAAWLDHLEPALGASEHFYEPEMRKLEGVRKQLTVVPHEHAGTA